MASVPHKEGQRCRATTLLKVGHDLRMGQGSVLEWPTFGRGRRFRNRIWQQADFRCFRNNHDSIYTQEKREISKFSRNFEILKPCAPLSVFLFYVFRFLFFLRLRVAQKTCTSISLCSVSRPDYISQRPLRPHTHKRKQSLSLRHNKV